MKRLLCVTALAVATPVLADEAEVSFAYVPAPTVEKVTVRQPLGHLNVRGWDKPEVRIAATKRAPDRAGLDRLRVHVDMKDGHLEIVTGVRVGEALRPIPTDAGYAIDLDVDAPQTAQIEATTFDGDLDATGMRAGVVLTSSGGAIHATDIDGPVRAHATRGRQRLAAIRGDIEAEVLVGALELDSIDGAVLHAIVVSGPISARRIRSRVVELVAAKGDATIAGAMPLGGRWVLRAPAGDGHILVDGVPMTLVLHAGKALHADGSTDGHTLNVEHIGSARLLEADVGGALDFRSR